MPSWLINILISLAVDFGVPWLLNHIPWIPDNVKTIIEDLLKKLENPKADSSALVKDAKAQVKACSGVGCESDLK